MKIINFKKEKKLAINYMKKVDIRPRIPEMLIDKLSGGNQQKVVFAKWLASNPKVLIVDEPTLGVDIGAKTEIHKLLWDLVQDGIGIIMISSELPEILAVSSRVIVMNKGRIAEVFENTNNTTQGMIMKATIKSN